MTTSQVGMRNALGPYNVAMIWAQTATMPRAKESDASVTASAATRRITVFLRGHKEQYANIVPILFRDVKRVMGQFEKVPNPDAGRVITRPVPQPGTQVPGRLASKYLSGIHPACPRR